MDDAAVARRFRPPHGGRERFDGRAGGARASAKRLGRDVEFDGSFGIGSPDQVRHPNGYAYA